MILTRDNAHTLNWTWFYGVLSYYNGVINLLGLVKYAFLTKSRYLKRNRVQVYLIITLSLTIKHSFLYNTFMPWLPDGYFPIVLNYNLANISSCTRKKMKSLIKVLAKAILIQNNGSSEIS